VAHRSAPWFARERLLFVDNEKGNLNGDQSNKAKKKSNTKKQQQKGSCLYPFHPLDPRNRFFRRH